MAVSKTVRESLSRAASLLEAAGCESPRLDAEVLLSEVLDVDRAFLFAESARALTVNQADHYSELVARREAREPIAYITGRKYFRHLELKVDQRVLIPRPETEHLIEAVLGVLPEGAVVVDVGTGSGAIALALKHERPDLTVIATDISPDAVALAQTNAEDLELEIDFRLGSLLEPITEQVDAVLSNPPYVTNREMLTLAPEILRFEPAQALVAGEDGLDIYRELIPQIASTGARLAALEVGDGQSGAVGELLRAAGFTQVTITPDLAGVQRVVAGQILD